MTGASGVRERRTSARGTSRAAVLTGPRTVEVRQVAAPEPGPGQVRVRLESCGVCASSIPVWQGREWFSYPQEPGAPGHEGCGVIDAVGEGVARDRVGERVAVLSYHAFAQHDLAPAGHAVPLPTELEGRHFPGEAIGCAMNIFRRSGIGRGQRVAVVGVGFIGALLVQLAEREGAEVVALSRRPFSLEIAGRMGAKSGIPTSDLEAAVPLATEAGGGLFDVVIECTGMQEPLTLAGRLVGERGRLVVAGFHQDGPRQVDMQLWNWHGIDVINAHERDSLMYVRGMREGAEAVASGRLDPEELYTHTYTIDRLAEAFEAAEERADGFVKAIVTMEA